MGWGIYLIYEQLCDRPLQFGVLSIRYKVFLPTYIRKSLILIRHDVFQSVLGFGIKLGK